MVIKMGDALREGQKMKNVGFYNKMWNPGDSAILVYPTVKDPVTGNWDIVVGQCFGHKADPKRLSLKTTFIPTLMELDENHKPIGAPDITLQFSRIAKAFVEGEKASKIAQLNARNFPTEETKRAAIQQVEHEYDTQNNASAVRPVVQGLSFIITTEVLYIPLKNDVPNIDEMRVVSQELSDKRIRTMMSILNDPKYCPDDEVPFLQLSMSYPTGQRNQAGQALPVGLTKDYRIETRYPDLFKTIRQTMESLPLDSDLIAAHNRSYVKKSEAAIKNSLTQYAIMQSYCLEALDEDRHAETLERLISNGKVLENLSVLPSIKNDTLVSKIREEIAKNEVVEELDMSKDIEGTTASESETAIPTDDMSPTIQNLLNQPHIGNEEDLANIDLDE